MLDRQHDRLMAKLHPMAAFAPSPDPTAAAPDDSHGIPPSPAPTAPPPPHDAADPSEYGVFAVEDSLMVIRPAAGPGQLHAGISPLTGLPISPANFPHLEGQSHGATPVPHSTCASPSPYYNSSVASLYLHTAQNSTHGQHLHLPHSNSAAGAGVTHSPGRFRSQSVPANHYEQQQHPYQLHSGPSQASLLGGDSSMFLPPRAPSVAGAPGAGRYDLVGAMEKTIQMRMLSRAEAEQAAEQERALQQRPSSGNFSEGGQTVSVEELRKLKHSTSTAAAVVSFPSCCGTDSCVCA